MHSTERWILYPLLALLCAVVFLRLSAVGADAPPDGAFGTLDAQQIQVRELKVLAADGTVLARLGTDADGGTLVIGAHPAKGKGGFFLDTRAGGGRAYSRNVDGSDAAYVGVDGEEQVGLAYTCFRDGTKATQTTAAAQGGSTMHYGPGGKSLAYVGAASDTGSGLFVFWGKDGQRGGEIAYGQKGGYLSTTGAGGKQTVFLGTAGDTGVGLLLLHRADGVRTLLLHGTEEGATLRCTKADGTEVLTASSTEKGGRLTLVDDVGQVVLPLRK